MEFPHINKYQSSIEKHLKLTHDGLPPIKYDSSTVQRQNLEQILSNINQINLGRSYPIRTIHEQDNTMASSGVPPHSSTKNVIGQVKETKLVQFSNRARELNPSNQRKSLIFAQKYTKESSKHERMTGRQVKIYYFNLPTYKIFNYDEYTTISDIIILAIDAYLDDKQLNSTKIQDKCFQNYQLRLLLNDNTHEADMNVSPLSYDRLIVDNLIDSFVLVESTSIQRKKNAFGSTQFTKTPAKSNFCKSQFDQIFLYNNKGVELAELKLKKQDSIEKIYKYIQQNGLNQMKSFYLTENKNYDYVLPKDFQIKNLQSNKIYIKVKRFIDQSEFEIDQTSVDNGIETDKSYEAPYILPITIKQASQYEQFTVIKVNKLGFQQERIIGIDQDKIYNYCKQVKEEKKSTSFFMKLFGVNETTGTKRPFRLIKDIIGIDKTKKGFNLTYSQKVIKYYVKTNQMKEKMVRKIGFLFNLANSLNDGTKFHFKQ